MVSALPPIGEHGATLTYSFSAEVPHADARRLITVGGASASWPRRDLAGHGTVDAFVLLGVYLRPQRVVAVHYQHG